MTTLLDDGARLAELERENQKLKRINKVLMDRVERSMDFQGGAFSLFQTAIVLEHKVRERTLELERALRELEDSHRDLARAKQLAETMRSRLSDAIESVNEGFALFDADDRLVLCNRKYLSFWPSVADRIQPGMRFREIAELVASTHAAGEPDQPAEAWLAQRLGQHRNLGGPHVHRLADGRWIQVNERRIGDGGVVGVYTDITDLKEHETRRRERELAEKSALLQATLDNIAQGVAVYDRDERLVAWNGRFAELLRLPTTVARKDARFADFVAFHAALGERGLSMAPLMRRACVVEQPWLDDSVLEISRNPMPDGGFVLTFSDITERRQVAQALEDAKESLERRVIERTAELMHLNRQLQQEIRERAAAEAAARLARAEAEQANLSKTKFLAAASHDLLQPLNAARLFVSALDDLEQPAANRTMVENIDVALASVEDLLAALLDISKLDAGAVTPELADFPVKGLLGSLATEYAPVARERGLDLRVVVSGAVVRSDIRLLRRIVQNFLSNALRYTARGRVLVGCRRVPEGLRIEVWDTGPGIPPDKLDEVFQEFRRLDTPCAASDRHRGIGLGLAIVDRVARMLGHPIGVRSEPGRGSVFSVTVPSGTRPRPARAPEVAARPATDRLAGASVLVLDNEPAVLAGMEALLRGWACRVTSATSGAEALRGLQGLDRPPDLLIADYHLDDGALGVTEIERLRAACGRRLPAIIITANRTAELAAEAQAQGCMLLNKPVRPAQLRALMSGLIG